MSAESFLNEYGVSLRLKPNALNLAYVENEGTERVRMTPWMIAHRLSHTFALEGIKLWTNLRNDFRMITWQVANMVGIPNKKVTLTISKTTTYALNATDMSYGFGTTKACRHGHLTQSGEWFHECFAQFLVTGKVKFNSAENVANRKDVNVQMWPADVEIDTKDYQLIDNELTKLSEYLADGFTKILKNSVDQLLVL